MSARDASGRLAELLRSVEHPGGRVSVRYRHGDLEVMVVEVAEGAAVTDPSLCGRSAWHLVLEGQAALTVGGTRWELLPDESLRVDDAASPCMILNQAPHRLRVLSVVVGGDSIDQEDPL